MKIFNILFFFLAFFLFFGKSHAVENTGVTVDQILKSYTKVQSSLVKDELAPSLEGTKVLQQIASHWLQSHSENIQRIAVQKIENGAAKLSSTKNIQDARKAFIEVSEAVVSLTREDKALKEKWQLLFCPMVPKKQGFWIQPLGEKLANPYMGYAMSTCGSKKSW